MSLQASKQSVLCRMAYSVEERVFIIETFYQASSFVIMQRVSEEVQQATGCSKICN